MPAREDAAAAGEREHERRAAPRWVVADLRSTVPLACRITPGHDVRVLNISTVGLLVESIVPLFPGRAAAVQLTRGKTRLALHGRIVRSIVSAIDRARGGATYESGIAFDRRIDAIIDFAVAEAGAEADAGADDRV